jgi:hypothetical protein
MLDAGPFVVSRKIQLDQFDEIGFDIGLLAEASRDQPGYGSTPGLFADGSENDGYPVRAFGQRRAFRQGGSNLHGREAHLVR